MNLKIVIMFKQRSFPLLRRGLGRGVSRFVFEREKACRDMYRGKPFSLFFLK
jgi:hypothetical protein